MYVSLCEQSQMHIGLYRGWRRASNPQVRVTSHCELPDLMLRIKLEPIARAACTPNGRPSSGSGPLSTSDLLCRLVLGNTTVLVSSATSLGVSGRLPLLFPFLLR